jgi:hypothetical protein
VLNLRYLLPRPVPVSALRAPALLAAFGLLLPLTGCKGHAASAASAPPRAQVQAELDTQREQMDLVALPTKSRFMAIHSFESWENPYITVQPGMLELHITLADGNTTTLGVGGMLRPIGARRQELNISLDKLADAITAIPPSAWPYGRVVAIEEAHKTPPSARPTVRRNMEVAVAKLDDLGIVVYDLNDGKIQ